MTVQVNKSGGKDQILKERTFRAHNITSFQFYHGYYNFLPCRVIFPSVIKRQSVLCTFNNFNAHHNNTLSYLIGNSRKDHKTVYLKNSIHFLFDRIIIDARFSQFAHQIVNWGNYVSHFFSRDVTVSINIVQRERPS